MSKVCKNCGRTAKMEDHFCMDCGAPLEKEKWVDMESAEKQEEKVQEKKSDILSMGDYLLILILMAIPVVNFIVCLFWILGKNGNPNRRNFAKAWMVLAVVGTIISGILSFGMFQFLMMDHYVDWEKQIEYRIPEEQFIDDFLTELSEV